MDYPQPSDPSNKKCKIISIESVCISLPQVLLPSNEENKLQSEEPMSHEDIRYSLINNEFYFKVMMPILIILAMFKY